MKTLTSLLFLALGCALFSGCSSVSSVDFPKGSSKGYSTYRFYNPELSQSADFSNREAKVNEVVQTALSGELNQHGLSKVDSNADLVVAYLILVLDNTVSTAINDYYINSGDDILSLAHKRVSVDGNKPRDFQAGTLVIDIIDQNTGSLIYRDFSWRQTAEDKSDAAREARIKAVVHEAIADFLR